MREEGGEEIGFGGLQIPWLFKACGLQIRRDENQTLTYNMSRYEQIVRLNLLKTN